MRKNTSLKGSRRSMRQSHMRMGVLQTLLSILVLSQSSNACHASICTDAGCSRLLDRRRTAFQAQRPMKSSRPRPQRTGRTTQPARLDSESPRLTGYTRRTEEESFASDTNDGSLPRHVAFVCDGNSRWAQARLLPASAGHAAGADRLVDCLDALKRKGVQCCTMYGFSTENWSRSPDEIRDVLAVMELTAKRFYARAMNENLRVKILGDLHDERIPSSLRETLWRLERDTSADSKLRQRHGWQTTGNSRHLTLCIAVNYGGRQDIVNASKKLAHLVSSGELNANDVSEEDFASCLCTSGVPDPDLIVRTGGEQRLSNFLLWNAAYAELYFTDTLWPDFNEASLGEALEWYSTRSRRFGGRHESVAALNGTSR